MRNPLKIYWGWVGPNGAMGPTGAIIFVLSLLLVFVLVFPPLAYLWRMIVGPWWAFLSAL